jgi:hypothetical protein
MRQRRKQCDAVRCGAQVESERAETQEKGLIGTKEG